ncbi:hypothetical protein ACKWTF_003144 [Chironomus riparius]
MKTKDFEEEVSDFEDELRGKNVTKKKKKLKSCFFCEKVFDVNVVEQSIRPKWRCQDCFDANIIKKVKYKEVKCNFCGIKYVDTYYTKKGLSETKTKNKKCEDCRNRKIPKGPLPRPKMDFAECDICGMRFRKKILIYNHMDKHRSDVCCRVCGAKFTARSALRSHLRSHFEKFVCELCGFTTNLNAMFRKHNKMHEGKPIPDQTRYYKKQVKGEFPCSICGILFESKVGLLGHEKRQHSENGVNGFSCKVCGEISYRIKEYRIHVLTHSSKPLLFCHYPGCNIFYDRLKPLNAHIRNVHKQTNNDYSCSNCGKAFKYKHSVDKHLRNNRCVPLKDRNFKKDVFSKRMKPFIEDNSKSPEELERIAKIAKEQYLEVRGLLSVIENEQHSDSEQDDTIKEEVIIEEHVNAETGLKNDKHDDVLEYDNYEQLDDCLDLSPVIESIEEDDDDNHDTKMIKEPFVKIEIKTEPDIDDMLSPPIIQEDWNYLKSDPDIFNMTSDLPNPYVLLERLDYATIMKWIKVKKEEKDIKPEMSNKMLIMRKNKKKMLKMRMLAYNRRIKGSSYECDMCEFKSKSKNKLAKHLINHKKVSKTNRHRCEVCSESFSRIVHLHQHKKVIHKISNTDYTTKDYICDLCGRAYGTIGMLKSHLKLTHSTTYYPCQFCPMKFKTRVYVERHENDVHLKIRKYACQFCGKCFKRKHGLKSHENRHTSHREICPICGKSVKILKEHIKFAHETKKEQELIPCPQCGRGFSKYNLQFHIERFHLKVINERTQVRHCLKCDQSFPRVDDLRR